MDRLAKEAAVEDGRVVYDKIPKEVIVTRGKTMDYKCGSSSGWIRGRGSYKCFFPISEKVSNTENTDISGVNYIDIMIW